MFKIVTYLSGARREADESGRSDRLPDGADRDQWTAHPRSRRSWGSLTVSQILAKSSDVGSIKMGLRLGNDRFYKYIRAFGFGSQTGIELPGETRGLAKPVSRWSKVSIGAISMGQEVGVTAVQFVSMVSTIANDGVYNAPRIVAGETQPSSGYQQVDVSSGAATERDFADDGGADAPHDGRRGALRNGAEGDSRRLHVCGKDGNGAEDRSDDTTLIRRRTTLDRSRDSLR